MRVTPDQTTFLQRREGCMKGNLALYENTKMVDTGITFHGNHVLIALPDTMSVSEVEFTVRSFKSMVRRVLEHQEAIDGQASD